MVSGMMSSFNSLAPVQSRKLADQVLEQLRSWLEQSELPVGSRLPTEPQLMQHFQVGRSTIREAVKALVYAGVLEVRPGDGTYIKSLPSEIESLSDTLKRADIAEVFEVRRTFETAIARLAAQNRDESDLKRMSKYLKACQNDIANKDFAGFLENDYNFHVAVAAASKNRLLADLYKSFRQILTSGISEALSKSQLRLQAVIDIHDQLFLAIKSRDPDRAQSVWLGSRNPYVVQASTKLPRAPKVKSKLR